MYKLPATTELLKQKSSDKSISNEAFFILPKLAALTPPLIPLPFERIMDAQMSLDKITVLTPGGTFGASDLPGHGMSTELAFDLRDVPKAVEIIVRQCLEHPFLGLISLRFVKSSSAFLAHTQYAPVTCAIEILAIASARAQEAFQRIWNALEQEQLAFTFHWGQCQDLRRLERVFGVRLELWLKARRSFLSETARRTFSNPHLEACGLAD